MSTTTSRFGFNLTCNMSSSSSSRLVVPGLRLCASEDSLVSGSGTYVSAGYIYASLVGRIRMTQEDDKTQKVEVVSNREQNVIPETGDIVTCRVMQVNPRMAKLNIVCVRSTALTDPFRAQLRKEDVRATEKDRVEMYKSFRPGDIILARVVSLGEANSGYLLTTSENELGVVIARSESAGAKMVPVSWTEMQCPKSYTKEFRKIAKVIPENLTAMAAM